MSDELRFVYWLIFSSITETRGVVARRDTGRFPGRLLSSEFLKPRKISNMNKILGEKIPHLNVDLGLQFRIRGGQHIQTSPCERVDLNMDRAAERGTRRDKLPRGLEN